MLQLWREERAPHAAVWWTALAIAVIARALYCQRALKRLGTDQRPTAPRTQGYAAVAALEGVVWATLLVLLPATSEVGMLFQLGLTVLIVLGVLAAVRTCRPAVGRVRGSGRLCAAGRADVRDCWTSWCC